MESITPNGSPVPGSDHSGIPRGMTDQVGNGHIATTIARRSKFQTFVFLLGLWTLPGLVYSVQIYQIGLRIPEVDASFFAAMFHALPVWWFWIPVTPLLVRLARRFPIRSTGAVKEVLIHLAISILVAVLVATLAGFWFSETAPFADRERPWSAWTKDLMLSTTLHLYFWCYWLIIAGVQFLDHERRLREQQVRTARLDALAAQSRTQMLANQLQPHFLFNALNGLSTLILRGDTESAQLMLESLASFLRESLRVGESRLVPLRDELDLISKYLGVEKVRLGDKLEIRTQVDRDTEGAMVPTLLLQPVVENAIRHGICSTEAGGEIIIRSDRVDNRLRLQVENDGVGLASGWQERTDDKVGLVNTERRLALLFEHQHEIRLEELSGGRVRVEIVIPFQTSRDVAVEENTTEAETVV